MVTLRKRALSLLPAVAFAQAGAGNVRIDSTTFPDAVFRNSILRMQAGADGILTPEECTQFLSIDLDFLRVEDLTGIEHLSNLRELSIEYTQVHTVDLRNNPNV